MPNIKVEWIVQIDSGIDTIHAVIGDVTLGTLNSGVSHFTAELPDYTKYFTFSMNGSGTSGSMGSFNFLYKGQKLLKEDYNFKVDASGLFNVYIPKVALEGDPDGL